MARSGHRSTMGGDTRDVLSMVIAYVRQETVGPVKSILRNAGLGVAGSALIGFGLVLLFLGLLRLLQTSSALQANLSFLPYLVTLGASGAAATIALSARGRRKDQS